jgi:uncharacterized protein
MARARHPRGASGRSGNVSLLAFAILTLMPASASAEDIAWQAWDEAVFQRAEAEQRFVLLDLGAVWCHWCHVMEATTYKDPVVVRLVRERFLPIRVDQDLRPDLSNRYEDYGWPATVIFDARGQELAKFSGYIAPARMRSLLQGVIDDPTPGPSVRPEGQRNVGPSDTTLPETLRRELAELLVTRYDTEHGGWGFAKKFLDWDGVEWSLARARAGDREAERRALEALDRQTQLIDPVWGGVFQYSDGGVWENPHFEKIMQFQAENLRVFSQAYAQTHEPRYLQAARAIDRYLRSFMRDASGAFYVSQDADLKPGEHSADYFALGDGERRRRGIPRVDTHLYARETAWAAHALVWFWAVSGDDSALADALAAARWIVAERSSPDGGYRHDVQDVDPRSRELLRTALGHPDAFKRVELWDRRDGPLPRPDVDYPSPEAPTAFVCRDGRCSAPLLTAVALSDRMSR